MRMKTMISTAILTCLSLVAASAVQAIDVSRSTLVDQPPAKVWAVIGDYGALDQWHPAVVKLQLSGDTASGVYRTLTLPDDGTIKEKLISHSDKDMGYSYTIESGVLPVANYVATLSVQPALHDPDMSVIRWSSSFDPTGTSSKFARDLIGGIYLMGFDSAIDKLK